MKRFHREDSPEALGKGSGKDLLAYRMEPLSKSFRKKHYPVEPSTVSSSSNLIKTFSKARIHTILPPRDSPSKPSERRSHSRGAHSRLPDKISLTSQAYHQSQGVPTAAKIMRVSAIFSKTTRGGALQALGQLYQQNDDLLQLLFEWQKLEIYDEIDRLVYQLTQLFVGKLESVIENCHKEMEARLQAYQSALGKLEQENRRLREEKENMQCSSELLRELQCRVNEEYHKNQWSNAILQQVRAADFDLDAFVRKMPLYRYVAYGVEGVQSEDYCEDVQRIRQSEGKQNIRQTKSEVTSQSNKSARMPVRHKQYHK